MAKPVVFDTIENAHEYIQLLGEAIDAAVLELAEDLGRMDEGRHRDAMRLASYKLHQLRSHVTASSRTLNDLRTLRRLLLNEREDVSVV